jgi:hypothetical protein
MDSASSSQCDDREERDLLARLPAELQQVVVNMHQAALCHSVITRIRAIYDILSFSQKWDTAKQRLVDVGKELENLRPQCPNISMLNTNVYTDMAHAWRGNTDLRPGTQNGCSPDPLVGKEIIATLERCLPLHEQPPKKQSDLVLNYLQDIFRAIFECTEVVLSNKKDEFRNCLSFKVHGAYKQSDSKIAIKLFQNGIMQISGLHDMALINGIAQRVCQMVALTMNPQRYRYSWGSGGSDEPDEDLRISILSLHPVLGNCDIKVARGGDGCPLAFDMVRAYDVLTPVTDKPNDCIDAVRHTGLDNCFVRYQHLDDSSSTQRAISLLRHRSEDKSQNVHCFFFRSGTIIATGWKCPLAMIELVCDTLRVLDERVVFEYIATTASDAPAAAGPGGVGGGPAGAGAATRAAKSKRLVADTHPLTAAAPLVEDAVAQAATHAVASPPSVLEPLPAPHPPPSTTPNSPNRAKRARTPRSSTRHRRNDSDEDSDVSLSSQQRALLTELLAMAPAQMRKAQEAPVSTLKYSQTVRALRRRLSSSLPVSAQRHSSRSTPAAAAAAAAAAPLPRTSALARYRPAEQDLVMRDHLARLMVPRAGHPDARRIVLQRPARRSG